MLDIARQVPPASRNGRIDKKDSNERARTNGPSCIFQQLRFPILEYESCGEFWTTVFKSERKLAATGFCKTRGAVCLKGMKGLIGETVGGRNFSPQCLPWKCGGEYRVRTFNCYYSRVGSWLGADRQEVLWFGERVMFSFWMLVRQKAQPLFSIWDTNVFRITQFNMLKNHGPGKLNDKRTCEILT